MKKFFKNIRKVEGMEEGVNTSSSQDVTFRLVFKNQEIGTLQFKNKEWIFEYSNKMKKKDEAPILDFPNPHRIYKSEELWPFFAARIPAINQPYQEKKLKKANANKDDLVDLLKVFGKHVINNPFKLIAV